MSLAMFHLISADMLPGRCLPRYCPATHVSRAPAAPALGSCHTLLIGQRHPADSDTRCFMNSTSPGSQTMDQLRPAYQALFPHPISPPLLDAMCVIPGYHLLLPSHSVQGILSALSRHTCSVRPGHTLATPLPQTVLILSQRHSTLRSDL